MSATREKLVARVEEIDRRLGAIGSMTEHKNGSMSAEEAQLIAERDILTIHLSKMPAQDLKDTRVLRG